MAETTPSLLRDARLPPLSLGLFGVALWNFRQELLNLSVTLPPIAAFTMGLGGTGLVVLAALFLSRTDLGVDARWRVTLLSRGDEAGIRETDEFQQLQARIDELDEEQGGET